MQTPETSDRTSWTEALREAARRLPSAPTGALLFHEDRQDLTLECSGAEGPVEHVSTRSRGLAARGPFGRELALHLGDPRPGDAVLLAEAIRAGDWRPLGGSRIRAARAEAEIEVPAREPLAAPADLLRLAVREVEQLHPSAEVQARWIGFDQEVLVALPGVEVRSDRRRGTRIRIEARVVVGDRPVGAVVEAVGDLDAARARALATRLVERLNAQARAHPVASGRLPAVFAPGVAGVLVHEIVGHALEGDVSLDRESWLGRLGEGERVAPRALTVVDDPRRGRGAWRIDDEGQAARPTALIRNGAVAGFLSDLRCARRTGRSSTGHGRRSSYREPVLPRMGCTFLAAGGYRPEQLLEGVDDGVYVRRMEAASTDPWTGRAVFRVTDADRIHRGRITSALMPHVLLVDAREVLAGIDRVADDLTFDSCVGSCVRDGQPLSISVGAPTIRTGLIRVAS